MGSEGAKAIEPVIEELKSLALTNFIIGIQKY